MQQYAPNKSSAYSDAIATAADTLSKEKIKPKRTRNGHVKATKAACASPLHWRMKIEYIALTAINMKYNETKARRVGNAAGSKPTLPNPVLIKRIAQIRYDARDQYCERQGLFITSE